MRYKRFLISLLSIFIIFSSSSAFAEEYDFEIVQEDLFPDEMKSYQRSFTVLSNYSPTVNRVSPISIPQMVWPTGGKEISSDYGWRPKPCKHCSSDHKGIDFVPGKGEPVYSAMDGIVSRIDYGGSFGQHIYIDHIANFNDQSFESWRTIYAHMEKDSTPKNLRVGSIVKAGDPIGTVGNTGTSTGAHLHFELLVEGENVDPEKYLLMYSK